MRSCEPKMISLVNGELYLLSRSRHVRGDELYEWVSWKVGIKRVRIIGCMLWC